MSDSVPSDPTKASRTFHYEDYRAGQTFTSGGRTVTDSDIRMYLGATGTQHSNHTDAEYCRRHPLIREICAPGVHVLGIVDAAIAERVTQHMAVSMNYGHQKIRYLRPTYVGDTIHAEITVTRCDVRDDEWGLIELEALGVNQEGAPVLFDSHVLVVQRRGGAHTGGTQ